jgi:DNA-binding helix-turn-helix protein
MIKEQRKRMGAVIFALREKRGLSREQLSNLTGLPVGQIARLENGRDNIKLSFLIVVAAALGSSIELIEKEINHE